MVVKSSFLLLLIEGDPSYQMIFTGSKILFLDEFIAFWNLENTGNYSTRVDFNRDLPKITIFRIWKPIFYVFYPIILKLNLIVLGVN